MDIKPILSIQYWKSSLKQYMGKKEAGLTVKVMTFTNGAPKFNSSLKGRCAFTKKSSGLTRHSTLYSQRIVVCQLPMLNKGNLFICFKHLKGPEVISVPHIQVIHNDTQLALTNAHFENFHKFRKVTKWIMGQNHSCLVLYTLYMGDTLSHINFSNVWDR